MISDQSDNHLHINGPLLHNHFSCASFSQESKKMTNTSNF